MVATISSMKSTATPINGSQNHSGQNCEELRNSPSVVSLLRMLKLDESSSAGIADYKISNHNLVILDSSRFPGCKIIREPKRLITVSSGDITKIENSVYDFCGGLQSSCPVNDVAVPPSGVALFDVGLLSKRAQDLYPQSSDEMFAIVAFSLLVHEGFHFFIQSRQFGLNLFPGYLTIVDYGARQQIEQLCYNSTAATKSLVQKEMKKLKDAFVAARTGRLTERNRLLREFVSLRETRYLAVSNVRIATDNTNLNCREVEARMEVGEGLADFSGLWALKHSMGWQAVDKFYQIFFEDFEQSSQHYYRLGSLEIFSLISSEEDKSKVFDLI